MVQTLADLGIAGLALTLALLAAWMAAAGRSTHPFNRRWSARWPQRGFSPQGGFARLRSPPAIGWEAIPAAYTPERIGLLTMVCVVVVFGVHSFADWTWYVPGNACVALLCAGWLAGRGPLRTGNRAAPAGSPAAAGWGASAGRRGDAGGDRHSGSSPRAGDDGSRRVRARGDGGGVSGSAATDPRSNGRPAALRLPAAGELSPVRVGIAVAVVAGALLAAWTEWQPQRSVDASEQALGLLKRNPVAALSAAQAGVQRDPLSASALFRLSAIQHATGESALARATLQKAVRLQPSNPETWLTLGEYDMPTDPRAAVEELRAAVYLDPESIPAQNAYVEALRKTGTAARAGQSASTSASGSLHTRPEAAAPDRRGVGRFALRSGCGERRRAACDAPPAGPPPRRP